MKDRPVRFPSPVIGALAPPDLLRECGRKLTDRDLWTRFQERFAGPIFKFVLRTLYECNRREDVSELVADLAQEVHVRLVQNNGQMLQSFRGETELSAVRDHIRREKAGKRFLPGVISLDEARDTVDTLKHRGDALDVQSILSWIDVERIVSTDPDRKNAQRNALIFKLHYIDGFSCAEIAEFPGFDLAASGIEAVVQKVRKRITNE
jgi:DNA-directed RNA polymerase specialized sigma24 family protein